MEVSNNLLAALVIVAMAISLTGTMSLLSIIPGQPSPITGLANLYQSGIANATLSSDVHIQLVDPWQTVDFHDLAKGAVNNTADFQPHPFVLRNNGSTIINVSIGESSSGGSGALWTNDDTCENCFMYNSSRNGTTGAVAYTAWRNFDGNAESADAASLATNPANLVYNLSNTASGDERDVYVHLNITAPAGELGGYKESTIYFKAGQA